MKASTEKDKATYGPLRHVYHRPFAIVYGTPTDQRMRLAMRDLAVYLANALYAAHHTFVPIFSDLEFRSTSYYKTSPGSNYVFIGDIHQNKVLKLLNGQASAPSSKSGLPFQTAFSTESLEFHGYSVSDEDGDDGDIEDASSRRKKGFSIGNITFDRMDHALATTFPLKHMAVGGMEGGMSLAVCLHANSAEGYLHLSRLSWPVIPPMVRAPLAGYLPDYVVISRDIWLKGPGGIIAAGYWDSQWRFDPITAYLSDRYL